MRCLWTFSKLVKLRWMKCGVLSATKGTHAGCGMRLIITRVRSWRMSFGRHKDEVFVQLKALLEPFGLTHYSTDHWGAYTRHLDPDVHSPGKRNIENTTVFQFCPGQHARCATIRPMRRAWFGKRLECTVHSGRGHAIQLGHCGDLRGAFGTFGRQAIQSLPQLEEGIGRNHLTARPHGWRAPDTPRPAQSPVDGQWLSPLRALSSCWG
jgi:hypothetical protein